MTVEKIIEAGKVYAKEEFLQRAGMSAHSFRTAKRKGLKTIPSGRRVYICGSDFITFLDQLSRDADTSKAGG